MKAIVLPAILLLLFGGCRRDRLIPEITPSILGKKFELKNEKEPPEKLGVCHSDIYFIQSKKNITRFNPVTGAMDVRVSLPDTVEDRFLCRDGRLVLKKTGSAEIMITNLETGSLEKTLVAPDGGNLLDMAGGLLVFRNQEQLLLMNASDGMITGRTELAGETVYNCLHQGKTLMIFTGKRIITYSPDKGTFETRSLEVEAGSPFLLWRNNLYYGSKDRELVRYSLKRGKTVWKVKLPMQLVLGPVNIGRYILVAPEDNNIYFFNQNATLYWWEKLNGSRLSAPVVMRENVAVFLMDRKVKFFNYKKKTVQDYILKTPVLSKPVYLQDYLYFVSRAEKKKGKKFFYIEKLGNQYHVRIKSEPDPIKPIGQSIEFTFTPVNLVGPEMDMKIINQKDESVFSKRFKKNEAAACIWVPENAGKFKLVLTVKSEKHEELNMEKNILIMDLGKIAGDQGRKAIEKCPLGNSP